MHRGSEMMWDGGSWAFMWVWLLFALALLLLTVLGIVWLVRALISDRGGGTRQPVGSAARDELDRRYARGELSREEYLQIRQDLEAPDR
jgi:putative membrane protein